MRVFLSCVMSTGKLLPHQVERLFVGDFMITATAHPLAGGHYQARAVVTSLGGKRTRAQRFIDLDYFPTVEEAVACARMAGLAYVETQG
jgi:hypothetical protein